MKNLIILLSVTILISCSNAAMVDNWKNPDIDTYEATKVLIVGMTSNMEARKIFEDRLKKEYESRGINATVSYKYFNNEKKTEEDLETIENRLLTDGFDTILFSKIIGKENKQRLANIYKDVDNTYSRFRDDYFVNQDIYYNPEYYEQYPVYHAEASLYCICISKERELIWKGYVDISEPKKVKETVKNYVKLIIFMLEENELLVKKDEKQNKL